MPRVAGATFNFVTDLPQFFKSFSFSPEADRLFPVSPILTDEYYGGVECE
jgi:hypothetical protein